MNNFRIQVGAMLAFLALLIGGASLLFASQVSLGPTMGAFACLVAIIARMIQSGGQHEVLARWRNEDRQART